MGHKRKTLKKIKGASCSILVFMSLQWVPAPKLWAEERFWGFVSHPWQRYLRDFRREHHFSVSSGRGDGSWKIGRFGTQEHTNYAVSSVWLKLRYDFHIQLYQGLGYFLGSSVGYAAQSTESGFSAPISWHLPGLTGGLVCNVNPELRFLIFQEVYLERLENMSTPDGAQLDASMLCLLDGSLGADYFFSLNFGLRAEAHFRKAFYTPPKQAAGSLLPEGGRFEKWERWFGLGLVMQLL